MPTCWLKVFPNRSAETEEQFWRKWDCAHRFDALRGNSETLVIAFLHPIELDSVVCLGQEVDVRIERVSGDQCSSLRCRESSMPELSWS